ncbi:hypothetical protein AMD01_11190 [Priestia koreensis]|uniref:Uncharacterized protein n=2 Tax=Priestia koreensis TaxID=284581 RepID=A0A0M0L6U8_9BACI|nr:hypothetical protein AMD01_11190 [Priestia koreensis]
MPSLPVSNNQDEAAFFAKGTELMNDIAFLNRKSGMSHQEIMSLPYGIYLSYIKQNTIAELMETQEGREYLATCQRVQQKTPDLAKLRGNTGYKEAGDNE